LLQKRQKLVCGMYFEEVKLDHIVGITVTEHLASAKKMEKAVDLKYEKRCPLNLDVVYYTLTRSVAAHPS